MEANFAKLPERCGGCECTCEYLRHADKQLGASVGLWFWLNTRPFAHRAVRIDATLNRMIAGTAREYLEFVIAAAVGARAPPDYPHTFAAMLTDWIANPLVIQHDTNAPQLTQHSTLRANFESRGVAAPLKLTAMERTLLSSSRHPQAQRQAKVLRFGTRSRSLCKTKDGGRAARPRIPTIQGQSVGPRIECSSSRRWDDDWIVLS
jgi:hypothetical protein